MKERPKIPSELNDASGAVIGAAIEVHRHLGRGLLERIYEDALSIELELRGRTVHRQVVTPVWYKGREISGQRLDLLVEPGVVVEIKATDTHREEYEAQLLSYLRATGHRVGLLVNFNVDVLKLGVKRMVL